MCVWNSRDGESTTHCCPQGPGTSLAFTCIKSECPTQARMGGGGVWGGVWEFQMTSALILLVTMLLF